MEAVANTNFTACWSLSSGQACWPPWCNRMALIQKAGAAGKHLERHHLISEAGITHSTVSKGITCCLVCFLPGWYYRGNAGGHLWGPGGSGGNGRGSRDGNRQNPFWNYSWWVNVCESGGPALVSKMQQFKPSSVLTQLRPPRGVSASARGQSALTNWFLGNTGRGGRSVTWRDEQQLVSPQRSHWRFYRSLFVHWILFTRWHLWLTREAIMNEARK